jgi:hypothetical protein
LVDAGKFTEIYDPKAGEKEPWCINDHTFARGPDGTWHSKDPFHWASQDQVGAIYAHAADVVRDVDGKWYISHAGWEHGGLSLAPLIWHDGLDAENASLGPGE